MVALDIDAGGAYIDGDGLAERSRLARQADRLSRYFGYIAYWARRYYYLNLRGIYLQVEYDVSVRRLAVKPRLYHDFLRHLALDCHPHAVRIDRSLFDVHWQPVAVEPHWNDSYSRLDAVKIGDQCEVPSVQRIQEIPRPLERHACQQRVKFRWDQARWESCELDLNSMQRDFSDWPGRNRKPQ